MSDDQLRQVIPRAESHQSLANNPATSRPPPPRNRSRALQSQQRTSSSRSASSTASRKADTDTYPLQATATSPDAEVYEADEDAAGHAPEAGRAEAASKYGALTGNDDASGRLDAPHVMARTSSSSSGRSYNSRYDQSYFASEIPKEEIELALQGLTRDDLVVALGRAKVQMDEIDAKLDAQILASEELQASSNSLLSQLNLAEAETESLHMIVRQREERIDEIMADQERMESEMFSKMQVIESLRKQLNESEKRRNDAERRYGDQTTTMDKERQCYVDTEALLKSQKATQAASYEKLLSQHHDLFKQNERLSNKVAQLRASGAFGAHADDDDDDLDSPESEEIAPGQDTRDGEGSDQDNDKVGASGRRPHSTGRKVSGTRRHALRTLAEEKEHEKLQEELATIRKSHSSLTDAMTTLQTELKDVKAENAVLRDQNETFIDILQEKTFSGALLNESAMFSASMGRRRLHGSSELMGPYESDDEDDDDDFHDDNELEGDTTGSTSIEEDEDDVPDTPKAPTSSIAAKQTNRSARRRNQSTSLIAPPPTDLASELEQTETPQLSSEALMKRQERRNERHGAISDNVQELQNEVRELREANQALTLYITKIIERIIAREGYENILAVDGKGTLRGTSKRKQSRANLRASVLDTFDNPNRTQNQRSVSDASNTSATSSNGSGGGGGMAAGFFRFGSGASAGTTEAAAKPSKAAPPKSKRTSSIDWRNLPFLGGGGSSNAQEANANLKPLTLASTSPLLGRDSSGPARKVRTSEEVEDEADVAEREHIREELLKRGIQPPSHQLVQSPRGPNQISSRTRPASVAGSAGGGFAAFISRVVTGGNGSSTATSADRSDGLSDTSSTAGSRFNSLESAVTRSITRSRSGTIGASAGEGGENSFPRTSTPVLSDPAKRREERNRAIQLSGNGLTEFTAGVEGGATGQGGIGAGARARALARRAERQRALLSLSTEDGSDGKGHGSKEDDDDDWSSHTPTSTGLRSVSSESSSGLDSTGLSQMETSIAGDESYSLPPAPSSNQPDQQQQLAFPVEAASPLMGHGTQLPPLPSMTTGQEDPNVYGKPGENTASTTAGGWKRALRRISTLGGGGSGASGASSPRTNGDSGLQSPLLIDAADLSGTSEETEARKAEGEAPGAV